MISIDGFFVIQIVSVFQWHATLLNWRRLRAIDKVPQRALKHSINILVHQLVFILFIFVLDYDELHSFFNNNFPFVHSCWNLHRADALQNLKKLKV